MRGVGGRHKHMRTKADKAVGGSLPVRPYPEYSRDNSYSWSPFLPRRARPGPGPHSVPAPSLSQEVYQPESGPLRDVHLGTST